MSYAFRAYQHCCYMLTPISNSETELRPIASAECVVRVRRATEYVKYIHSLLSILDPTCANL